jgi:hypothetical protein
VAHHEQVPFGNLPFIVQFATTLSLCTAWVCFEEFVIDPGRDNLSPVEGRRSWTVVPSALVRLGKHTERDVIIGELRSRSTLIGRLSGSALKAARNAAILRLFFPERRGGCPTP